MRNKTLVIGASDNEDRYAYKAVKKLRENKYEVIAFGTRKGIIGDTEIQLDFPTDPETIDTVTLYIGPGRQPEYYDKILALKPRRVIFNPGTENELFEDMLSENGIEATEACTLVLLASKQY